jgi:hypothetical protein
VERTGPVTFGQLSVMRSLEAHGPAGQTVANLVSIWEIPRGVGVARAGNAWCRLVAAHESLRTSYDEGSGTPVQIVHTFAPNRIEAVELAEATESAARQAAAAWAAEPIHVDRCPPWRAFVATHCGIPLYLVTVVHHIAADNGALTVLERQFRQLLADDGALGSQVQPIDVARAQRADPRKSDPIEHWVDNWDSFLPEDRLWGDVSRRRRATRYSIEGLLAAREISQRLQVSLQAVVLAVGSLALSRRKQRNQITFGLMAANRLNEPWSSVVSSFNQCAPLTISLDEDAKPSDFLHQVYKECLIAYLNGCFDVDELSTSLDIAGYREKDPTFFSVHYNFLGGTGEPPADSPMRRGVLWRESAQRQGPNMHLAIAVGQGLLIGVGASEDYLTDELPAELAMSIEVGLIQFANGSAESLSELSLDPAAISIGTNAGKEI